ncbi:MAG: 2-oxoacid:acceptor oxidoreductase family protein [Clostridia bacterium]|nr:2-oxoacid:acceptor oxidoreductase family protein [Clostridia bacterium]
MSTVNILLAGFGGQGILFAGKILAYAGLMDGKEVSWLPSYGPEMRGGTANCSVCISDLPIGSPLITEPDYLIAMNRPSLEKFVGSVVPGGKIFVESSLIDQKVERTDVETFYVPATALAEENDLKGLANIILLGKVLSELGFLSAESVEKAINKCVPPKKAHLIVHNLRAIELGGKQ